MKKSKVIVPALALIAFSTAASITGSVAWFTASRKSTVTAGNFQVVNMTNNLTTEVGAGVGTSVGSGTNQITVQSATALTDSSFDHVNKNVFYHLPEYSGGALENPITVTGNATTDAPNLKRSASGAATTVYSAYTFTMEFRIPFGDAGKDAGLFFNPATSTFSGNTTTALGFRMAFFPIATSLVGGVDGEGTTRVWANRTTADNTAGKVKYVNDKAVPAGIAYESSALITRDSSSAVPGEGTKTSSQAADMPNYLGKFTFAANTTSCLKFVVVCWFEGTDPEIVSGATIADPISATMQFEAVSFS